MVNQVVKVRRETLKACMSCPLCNKLLKEATTISLCLHTFCRKCIYEKLSDDDVDCCPVCNIDLGFLPVEKLRPDHNLQDIRAKIFPYKQRKIKAPAAIPSISLPIKRKERSLSSLVVSTPKVSVQTGLTGRRTKPIARKSSITKKEQSCPVSSTLSDSLNGVVHNRIQDSSTTEHSNMQNGNENVESNCQLMEGKANLWTPLNCLVDAANKTKSSKSKDESLSARENEAHVPETRVQDVKNGVTLLPGPAKRRRLCPVDHERSTRSEDLCVIDDAGVKQNGKTSPIWLSLVASEDQKGDVSLPQISSCYLRIKDGTAPVSLIQKYLVKKLDLASESEVEIMCRGQPVLPSFQLHTLVDLWFRTASTPRKVPKDFVMVLSYCRRAKAT